MCEFINISELDTYWLYFERVAYIEGMKPPAANKSIPEVVKGR